jgi:HD-like signal output (HDOD) protein
MGWLMQVNILKQTAYWQKGGKIRVRQSQSKTRTGEWRVSKVKPRQADIVEYKSTQIVQNKMPNALQEWVHRISEEEMPIFKYTAETITRVTEDDDTSSGELANVILQDASLTARILKLANSNYYNPTGAPINTISRAIVFIGFNLVRDLSLSLAIIDALLQSRPRARVMELMSRSFHAAVQARNIAEQTGDDSPEEIFIATLLHELGEMAFWCIAGEKGDELLEAMEDSSLTPAEAQQKVLGFTFSQLTLGLTQNWHLSDLLNSAINKPNLKNPRIQNIVHAIEISQQSLKGWHSPEMKKQITALARYLNRDEQETLKMVTDNAQHAMELAQSYGAKDAAELIPQLHTTTSVAEQDELPKTSYPEADPMLQLNILRDLSSLLETRPNLNLVLELILEGIHRGIGMDRALLALLNRERNKIDAKYVVSMEQNTLREKFSFPIQPSMPNIFAMALAKKQPLWINDSRAPEFADYMTPHIKSVIGANSFFLAPIIINQKPIGLFYADRQPSQRELDTTSFESFKHFSQQACIAIEHLSH